MESGMIQPAAAPEAQRATASAESDCTVPHNATTIEASPTVVPKSTAICGRSESVTRTIAWLAKPAPANRTMERVGTFSEDDRTDTKNAAGCHSGATDLGFTRDRHLAMPKSAKADLGA